jgi:hypothetical protein
LSIAAAKISADPHQRPVNVFEPRTGDQPLARNAIEAFAQRGQDIHLHLCLRGETAVARLSRYRNIEIAVLAKAHGTETGAWSDDANHVIVCIEWPGPGQAYRHAVIPGQVRHRVSDRFEVVQQPHGVDGEFGRKFICGNFPVVVREAHALVDDRAGGCKTDSAGRPGLQGFQIIFDCSVGRFVIVTLQRNDVRKCGLVGIGKGEAGIGTAYVADQQALFGRLVTSNRIHRLHF